jgi:hypothetical protein
MGIGIPQIGELPPSRYPAREHYWLLVIWRRAYANFGLCHVSLVRSREVETASMHGLDGTSEPLVLQRGLSPQTFDRRSHFLPVANTFFVLLLLPCNSCDCPSLFPYTYRYGLRLLHSPHRSRHVLPTLKRPAGRVLSTTTIWIRNHFSRSLIPSKRTRARSNLG